MVLQRCACEQQPPRARNDVENLPNPRRLVLYFMRLVEDKHSPHTLAEEISRGQQRLVGGDDDVLQRRKPDPKCGPHAQAPKGRLGLA